ncbi:EscR/YscR/HrcR family type III secretion system export apparatus protein [Chitinasiproducens palmae]|uniref:Type III secretion protein R n=1 Tax=Chitinasiproducens palmae TaxID=1770053 RepID=A0A1H2PJ78_9BURK|nr:hypothetical protein [Chitinasiproducens palmae]SDV46283.1 type III secretion protein R [Chitinasiproducens palmae]
MTVDSPLSLIVAVSLATLLPIIIASGTCFLKISIVLVIVRNALGVQQAPSNMVLHSVALALSLFVMMPIGQQTYRYLQTHTIDPRDAAAVDDFFTDGLGAYRAFLKRQASPDMIAFFERAQRARLRIEMRDGRWSGGAPRDGEVGGDGEGDREENREESGEESGNGDARGSEARADAYGSASHAGEPSLFALLPAYALSEIKDAFRIGFLIYLPFVVVDMVVSSVLLALGMMMMSPIAIAIPIKLALFVAVDGWSLLGRGLIEPYLALPPA